MKPKFDLFTVLLVACAVITSGFVIRRELIASPEARAGDKDEPQFVDDWKSLSREYVRLGPPDAPVQLIEFADFQCPFCATLHQSLKQVRARYPAEVAVIFVHYPLPGHRFALPAARAAECAETQGRFEKMHDLIFEHQDQLGVKTWADLASAAGVPDMAAFASCIQSQAPVPRVERGVRLADRLEIQGTPTLIVNGWRLSRPPTLEQLDTMVKRILAGKRPV